MVGKKLPLQTTLTHVVDLLDRPDSLFFETIEQDVVEQMEQRHRGLYWVQPVKILP